jgi:hypothetical protein
MKRLKLVGVIMGALFVLAVMASNALAAVNLPDISVTLTGGIYPVHAVGTLPKALTFLGDASGVVLQGTGVTLLLLTKELSALGTFTTDFTNVEEPKTGAKCSSTGDASGVVLVSGEFHLVPLEVSAALPLGVLFLVTTLEIKCKESIEVVVRGNTLSTLENIGTENQELTGFAGTLEGELGKPKHSEYFNDGGTKILTKLEIEAGAGEVAGDEDVVGQVGLSVLGSQMVVITNR